MIKLDRIYTMTCTTSVPTLFGVGASEKIGDRLKAASKKKAAIICDKGVLATGMVDKIQSIIESAGIESVVFSDVNPDPYDSDVDKAVAFIRENDCDSIVAIGGGASLDTGKAASVVVVHEAPTADFTAKKASAVNPRMYCIAVPTTAGTGSEGSNTAVITRDDTGHKGGVSPSYPALAVVDPALTLGLPQKITATTGMDAMAHAVEALLGSNREMMGANPYADLLAEDALRKIVRYLPRAYEDGSDMEARANMCMAANTAGMCIAEVMLPVGHTVAHNMGALFHIPHGAGCAVSLPIAVRWLGPHYEEKIRLIADIMSIEAGAEDTADDIAVEVAEAIRQMNRDMKIPSFKELGLTADDVSSLVDECLKDPAYLYFCEFPLTKEVWTDLIMEYYEG